MTATPTGGETLTEDLRSLWSEVEVLCSSVEPDLSAVVLAAEDELTDEDARELLTEIIVRIRARGDQVSVDARERLVAEVRDLVARAVASRATKVDVRAAIDVDDLESEDSQEIGRARTGVHGDRQCLGVFEYAGMEVRSVRPTPVFLGREIPLTEGFVDVLDLNFWEDNKRLRIDLTNFRRRENRAPDVDELKKMLWPKGDGPKGDEFKIKPLADDIAVRGVVQPPVIDYWGTAWDGNRRIAACLYVLANNDYDDAAKQRARYIRVWQTDEHATRDQIGAVVRSLNFGDDHKLPWPEYVRAREVYDAFVYKRDLEESQRTLSERDVTKIRQKVAGAFGIRTDQVTRFCKMCVWADEFIDHQREQDRDEADILVRTSQLFQYFYELDSGRGDDKVATKLKNDDGFRAIVFDLMFEGKFKNWSQIRDLRRVYETPAALDELKKAHAETSTSTGRVHVVDAIDLARQQSAALRQAGMADELARVARWLNEQATVAVLRKIDHDVLREFRDAARAVDGMITSLFDPADATTDA